MAEIENKDGYSEVKKMGKGKNIAIIIIVLVLAAAGAAGAFFYIKLKKASEENEAGIDAYEKGDYSTAIHSFIDAINNDSRNLTYRINLGMAYMGDHNYDAAMDQFAIVFEKTSNNELKLTAEGNTGVAYYRVGNYDSAVSSFNNALNYAGKVYSEEAIDFLYYLADVYAAKGEYANEILTYNKIVDQTEDVIAYTRRGIAYNNAGDPENAKKDLQKAIDLKSDDYNVYMLQHKVLLGSGSSDEALNVLIKALDIPTKTVEDKMNKGTIYLILDEKENAEKMFLSIVRDDKDARGYIGLGNICNKNENFEQAAQYLGEFFKDTDGNNARACNEYGYALMKLGRAEEAIGYFEKGIALNDAGEDAALRKNLALAYELILDWDKAYEAMNEYIVRYPEDAEALKEFYFIESRQR